MNGQGQKMDPFHKCMEHPLYPEKLLRRNVRRKINIEIIFSNKTPMPHNYLEIPLFILKARNMTKKKRWFNASCKTMKFFMLTNF